MCFFHWKGTNIVSVRYNIKRTKWPEKLKCMYFINLTKNRKYKTQLCHVRKFGTVHAHCSVGTPLTDVTAYSFRSQLKVFQFLYMGFICYFFFLIFRIRIQISPQHFFPKYAKLLSMFHWILLTLDYFDRTQVRFSPTIMKAFFVQVSLHSGVVHQHSWLFFFKSFLQSNGGF